MDRMLRIEIILPYPVNLGNPDSDSINKAQDVVCVGFEGITNAKLRLLQCRSVRCTHGTIQSKYVNKHYLDANFVYIDRHILFLKGVILLFC
ncbi:hypothetical protein MTBBW1_540009 [Desulfamplus magnetovallimortis]|uniref:Uncharacterized protein n=1 Tax=Desulfamplus magnetovallimortis TaxID=1246637 RepID=A0A1W1HHV6_9BACT|nr:hypothetical protein MTBBW1_540009 [Desulfamplus magnetovallimortis]